MGASRRAGHYLNTLPLQKFDYSLVSAPLSGFLINVDRDLQKRAKEADSEGNAEGDRQFTLLDIMLRFAINSYEAVIFLAGDKPEYYARRPNFGLVVPTINRQLLDLLFSLVFMLDDFPYRSLLYQRAAYREMREEDQQFRTQFASKLEWRSHFRNTKRAIASMVERFGISQDEQTDPSLIPYWKHPYELQDEKTPSRPFLRYLSKWLYSDTSAQSHLSFAGLSRFAPFLIADLYEDERKRLVQGRMMQQFRFQYASRTAFVTLAIASEIDRFCQLGNQAAASYLWVMFSEHVPEAKELWQLRYQTTS